jgi:hypothetical protein
MRPALTTAAIVAAAGILAGGLALRPAFAVGGTINVGPFTITHCSNSSACKTFINAGVGAGVKGSNTNVSSGAGLLGTATQGATGVEGQSTSGPGLLGVSSTANGVSGASASGYGVSGSTNSNATNIAGVEGSNNSTSIAVRANGFGGLLFDGNNSVGSDVFTVDNSGNTVISGNASVYGAGASTALGAGSSSSFTGVRGEGYEGVVGFGVGSSPYGIFAYNDASSGGEALGVQDASGTGVLLNGFDSAGNLKLQVGDDGTVYAHNFVIAFDSPEGQKVTNYATMSSTPNVEDFGEAQLTGGQAYVSLKRSFGAEIDSHLAYMVFITPEGDTRGVYVTQKTPAGFVVRENQGGRSDAAFSYRIVAKALTSTTASIRPSAPPPVRPHLWALPKVQRVPKTRP